MKSSPKETTREILYYLFSRARDYQNRPPRAVAPQLHEYPVARRRRYGRSA
jgi:hypothetical protein